MAAIISPDEMYESGFMNDTNGTTPVPTNASLVVLICKHILIQQIGGNSVRLWDLAILIPNFIFMVFLLYKFRRIRARLSVTRSPVYKAFYLLVYIATIVSITRCVVSMTISVTNRFGEYADKVLWLVLKFFMLSAELCVLMFGLLFGHLDSRTSIRRVLVGTVVISLVFSTVQSLLEFKAPEEAYSTPSDSIIDLFAHGGMVFLMVTSALFVIVYSAACVLPLTRLRARFALPMKRRFYVYCGFLAIIYCLQVTGSAMILRKNLYGMCILDFTSYIYFAFYTPVVYFTFLRGHTSNTQSVPLFSYRPQKDETGIPELPDAGNYLPGLPGITSPSYDDILYHPDFYDATPFDDPNYSPNPLYNYPSTSENRSVGLGGVLVLGEGDRRSSDSDRIPKWDDGRSNLA